MSTHHPVPAHTGGIHTRTTTTVVTEPVPEYESLKSAAAAHRNLGVDAARQVASGELRAFRFSDKPGSAIRLRRADVMRSSSRSSPKPTTSIVPGGDVAGFRLPQRLSLSELSAERGSRLHAYLQVSALQRNRVQ